jgi:hypothetical protein
VRPSQVQTRGGYPWAAGACTSLPLRARSVPMQAKKRKRPLRRERIDPPEGVSLELLALRAVYVGSNEHKTYPSPAGPPKLRKDATACDPSFKGQQALLTEWLREGMVQGNIGAPWIIDFPRYVWVRKGDVCYEGYATNHQLGQYKGYPLRPHEIPDWL